MAYPTRRALRLAGQEDEQPESSAGTNGKLTANQIHGRRRDSRDETGSDDEERPDLMGGLRRSKRITLSRYRSINKGILVAQAIPLEEMTEIDVGMDMYSRVKSGSRQHYSDDGLRVRRPTSNGRDKNRAGVAANGEVVNGDATDNDSEHEDDEEDAGDGQNRGYNLRRHRAQPQFFVIENSEPRRRSVRIEHHSHRRHGHRHRHEHGHHHGLARSQLHSPGSCSTTPSSSGESDLDQRGRGVDRHAKSAGTDDADMRFERRRVRSMASARRDVLPVNFTSADLELLGLKDRIRAGASIADIDPMYIDKTTSFENIGGLEQHIRQLKEMIVFPLLYPEMFSQFGIVPPRGVLFFGPPGTGKTLLARALANECSKAGGKRVAFFMRRGADCLSKWVGESERQLRLLFDQAYQLRPSIIFFDEVDGLAPVRSSRQDQIHSSIVSTLLALMDGLDSRQEVVVIGATNRIDSIDPALRRPGRFDREFIFRLPNRSARRDILQIHTRAWQPPLSLLAIDSLSERTVGFSGADLRGLCTEAVLNAVRRRYPQIYNSRDRLLIDPTQLRPTSMDFSVALASVMPTAARARQPLAWPLSEIIRPLLSQQLQHVLCQVSKNFPLFAFTSKDDDESNAGNGDGVSHASSSQVTLSSSNQGANQSVASSSALVVNTVHNIFRPRFFLCGRPSQGHISHVAPAVLHSLEEFQVHVLSMGTIFGAGDSRSPEDAVQQVVTEAVRTVPSVLYLPDLDQLLAVATPTLRIVLQLAIESIKPDLPILLFATARQPSQRTLSHVPMARDLFRPELGHIYDMHDSDLSERRAFFLPLFKLRVHSGEAPMHSDSNGSLSPTTAMAPPFPPAVEQLPLAPPPPHPSVSLSEAEKASLFLKEEVILRELRVFLREVLNRLLRDRRFGVFSRPVDKEDAPDYYDIISTPMDLSQMMSKIDRHEYAAVSDFVSDIDLIAKNALEYNPETDTNSRAVRHRACALRDQVASLIDSELDPDFERQCLEIKQSRLRRGIDAKKTAPAFIYTPSSASAHRPTSSLSNTQISPQPHPASATVALVQMQQALQRGETTPANCSSVPADSGGSPTSTFCGAMELRPRETRSGTIRAHPSTRSAAGNWGANGQLSSCKRRRVDTNMIADEAIQSSTLACTHAVVCGSFLQQQQFDGLLERLIKLTDGWSVDELHRVFLMLSKVIALANNPHQPTSTSNGTSAASTATLPASEVYEKYETIVSMEEENAVTKKSS